MPYLRLECVLKGLSLCLPRQCSFLTPVILQHPSLGTPISNVDTPLPLIPRRLPATNGMLLLYHVWCRDREHFLTVIHRRACIQVEDDRSSLPTRKHASPLRPTLPMSPRLASRGMFFSLLHTEPHLLSLHFLSVSLNGSTLFTICAYLNLTLLLLTRLASTEHSHFHIIIVPSSLFLAVL